MISQKAARVIGPTANRQREAVLSRLMIAQLASVSMPMQSGSTRDRLRS